MWFSPRVARWLALTLVFTSLSLVAAPPAPPSWATPPRDPNFSDEFDGARLDPRWITVSPHPLSKIELNGRGALRLSASGQGSGGYYSSDYPPGGNANAPRILQPVDGDWTIETRLSFNPTQEFQGAGVLVCFDGAPQGGGCWRVVERQFIEGRSVVNSSGKQVPFAGSETHFRVRKQGSEYTIWSSADGRAWSEVGHTADRRPPTHAGLMALRSYHAGAGQDTVAEFDYFRFSGAPPSPSPTPTLVVSPAPSLSPTPSASPSPTTSPTPSPTPAAARTAPVGSPTCWVGKWGSPPMGFWQFGGPFRVFTIEAGTGNTVAGTYYRETWGDPPLVVDGTFTGATYGHLLMGAWTAAPEATEPIDGRGGEFWLSINADCTTIVGAWRVESGALFYDLGVNVEARRLDDPPLTLPPAYTCELGWGEQPFVTTGAIAGELLLRRVPVMSPYRLDDMQGSFGITPISLYGHLPSWGQSYAAIGKWRDWQTLVGDPPKPVESEFLLALPEDCQSFAGLWRAPAGGSWTAWTGIRVRPTWGR